jgi:flagellar export protein FliJ
MRQIRTCWPVLVKKAQDAVNEAQTEICQALARVDQLEASHERLCRLYDEYRLQEQAGQVSVMGMQASMNQRQFMAQLLNLQQRVVLDLSRAREQLALARKKRSMAEIELHKMKSMEEQDVKAVALDQQRHEQKRMDELGVRQFNLSMQR